jgi:type II secretory pathway pseudopilin PulG
MRLNRGMNRRGIVLLEVIVALTILAFGITSTIAVAVSSLDSVRRAEQDEDVVQRAAALMTAVSLWPRTDLDRHLGSRREGDMLLRIDRVSPAAYAVSIADSTGRTTMLRTDLYRQLPDSAKE